MKKIIARIKDLHYRRRIGKWFVINIKICARKIMRFFKGENFLNFVKSTTTVVALISSAIITIFCVLAYVCEQFVCPFFTPEAKTQRRLSLTEYNDKIAYLNTLDMLGTSNRIQVRLKTKNENKFATKGTGLDSGNVNFIVTYADGKYSEFTLNDKNFDNFEAGATDIFTVILPYGRTPFDIAEYKLQISPNVYDEYDLWHCESASVYCLLGSKPVLIAKNSWNEVAVFGDSDGSIIQSQLEVISQKDQEFLRASKLYPYILQLKKSKITTDELLELKNSTLDAFLLNSAKVLNVDIETVNIEGQNKILTYYCKDANISEYDSLDYDGLVYLDITFNMPLSDGSFTKTFELDTLGTDDFELGSTSRFKIELPNGLNVFDISKMSIRVDNPNDAWAPRFVRFYVNTDYNEQLELARITDNILISTYSTPVFYKNLIDDTVDINLSSQFCISNAQKNALEKKIGTGLGSRAESMIYTLQDFYSRQLLFIKTAVEIYTKPAQ